jgi:hypothetical protein
MPVTPMHQLPLHKPPVPIVTYGIAALVPEVSVAQWVIQNYGDLIFVSNDLMNREQKSSKTASTKTEDVDRLLPNKPIGSPWETSSTASPRLGELLLSVAERKFEERYRRLGWSTGPFALQNVKRQTREYWVAEGVRGARWLAKRLATESHAEVMDAVASLLADIGHQSIPPIVDELDNEPTRDQAEVLLKALGWIEAPLDAAARNRETLRRTLEKYASDEDADVRAAAYAATRILPSDAAVKLLARRRSYETDQYAREAIDEALADRK